MRFLSILCLSATLVLTAPPGFADTGPPVITVTGEGVVEATPDVATLSIGVTTQGATAAEAMSANSAALTAVLARLAGAGVAPRDMQTSNLSLNPNWTGYDSSAPTITSYVASNMLTVRVRALDGLGAVLDAAIADGANTLNGLTFGLAEPRPAMDKARTEAVADARAKAELLAMSAGVTLGRILSISEAGGSAQPMPMFKAEDSMASVPVAGGELGVSAAVTIVFEIVN